MAQFWSYFPIHFRLAFYVDLCRFWEHFGAHLGVIFGPRSGFGETLIRAAGAGETRFWGTKSELFYDFFGIGFRSRFLSHLCRFWSHFGLHLGPFGHPFFEWILECFLRPLFEAILVPIGALWGRSGSVMPPDRARHSQSQSGLECPGRD